MMIQMMIMNEMMLIMTKGAYEKMATEEIDM